MGAELVREFLLSMLNEYTLKSILVGDFPWAYTWLAGMPVRRVYSALRYAKAALFS